MWHIMYHQEPPFPTLFPSSRGNRCRGIIWKGRTGDLGTLVPISGYQHSHWFPLGGVTYLIKTRQVTQMSYAAIYKDLALLWLTVYSCVSTWPNHIFLHQIYRNAIRTISTLGQFTHTLPLAVYCITTQRNYFKESTCIISQRKYYGKKDSLVTKSRYIVMACGSQFKTQMW